MSSLRQEIRLCDCRIAIFRMYKIKIRTSFQLLNRITENLRPLRIELLEIAIKTGDTEEHVREFKKDICFAQFAGAFLDFIFQVGMGRLQLFFGNLPVGNILAEDHDAVNFTGLVPERNFVGLQPQNIACRIDIAIYNS